MKSVLLTCSVLLTLAVAPFASGATIDSALEGIERDRDRRESAARHEEKMNLRQRQSDVEYELFTTSIDRDKDQYKQISALNDSLYLLLERQGALEDRLVRLEIILAALIKKEENP